MKQVPMVSLIIPIYNVKKFLRQGIELVLQQTYSDYELLLVDDGSTDGCAEICDEYAAQYDFIRVFHKPNGGLGSARNCGFDNAKGEYVYIYDVDDRIAPDLLEKCVKTIERENVDLLVFGFNVVDVADGNAETQVAFTPQRVGSNNELRDLWLDNFVFVPHGNGFVWNKFYRRSFLDKCHLRNADLRIQQDEEFNLRVYRHVESLYISSEVLYTYYIYPKGNNRARFIPNRFDIYKAVYSAFRDLQHYWRIEDPRLDTYLYNRFWVNIRQCLLFNLSHPSSPWSGADKRRELHRVMTDPVTQETIPFIRSHGVNIEQRLYLYAMSHENLFLLSAFSQLFTFLRSLKRILS